MHGLSDLQHDVIGNIHHVVNGPEAAQGQMPAHPPGAFPGGDIPNPMAQIPRTEILVQDGYLQAGILIIRGMEIRPGHFQFLPQHGRHLPGNPQNALAVRPVGSHGDVEQIIVQSHHGFDIRAGHRILRQIHQAVDLRAGIQIVVKAKLLTGTEHTV